MRLKHNYLLILIMALAGILFLFTSCEDEELVVAGFTVDNDEIVVADFVQFTDISSNDPISWKWDFGDGSISSKKNPLHTFDSVGLYTIKLTVTNEYGSDSETKKDYISVIHMDGTGDSIKDIDGNKYRTVWIGGQNWMAENLKTTTYNDGTLISSGNSYSAWENNTTGAYCWYDFNQAEYSEKYGALYNGLAVKTEKLCPKGWHVPDENEWDALVNYISEDGHSGRVGAALKAAYGWEESSNGTDDYGFSALPGGRANVLGISSGEGYYGLWYSAPLLSHLYPLTWKIDYNYDVISNYFEYPSYGLSIRCVKN